VGGIEAVLVFFGFLGTIFGACMVLLVLPFMWILAWIADRIPPLRRRDVGNEIRRQMRGKL
jgi:hypothetical protein